MGDPVSARSSHSRTLRGKFELEKHHLSYADLHREAMKNSPSNHCQKQHVGSKSMERDEIVRHMSNLPNYLETGKATPDRALNFGVINWEKLESWQYKHLKEKPVKSYSQPHRVTLRSHFNLSSQETFPSYAETCLGNADKFQDSEDKFQDFKDDSLYPPELSEPSSLKGKMNIQYPCYRNCHGNCETNAKGLVEQDQRISDKIRSHVNNNTPSPYALESEVVSKNLRKRHDSRNSSSDSRSNPLEEKRWSLSFKNSHVNMNNVATTKQRSMSPVRRFSFKFSSKSTTDNSCVLNRSPSSPLRRLLEPLCPNPRQSIDLSRKDSNFKAKPKLDLRKLDGGDHDIAESPSTTQALFQTNVKNGHPLFTFTIKNNINILAATVKEHSSKDNTDSWTYTFFTIDEVKKKNRNWLSQSRGDDNKGHGYVPNVKAQMRVSNPSISNSNAREFVLVSNVQPHDELAAIVVKFSRKVDDEDENQDRFSTTVILPGGNHGVSSKGKPSSLIERWLSSGVCDCGGWDLGCRLGLLTNQVQFSRRLNPINAVGQFELFFEGDVNNQRRFFSLCALKEGIFSVEYNSSLSALQAFSICISVVECRTSCQRTESKTYVAKQVEDDSNSVCFASFPPLSPVGRV